MIAICAYLACHKPFDANATKHKKGQERYCSRACCWADYTPRPLAERFWEKVDKASSPEGCWLWTGRRDAKTGYGTITERIPSTNKYRVLTVHRVGYTLQYGPIPQGLHVLHQPPCINRLCVRHLYVGTPQDNANDTKSLNRQATGLRTRPERRARGDANGARKHPERMPRGEHHGCAKLTDDDVAMIRTTYTGQRGQQTALAKHYHVTQATIWRIVKNKGRQPYP